MSRNKTFNLVLLSELYLCQVSRVGSLQKSNKVINKRKIRQSNYRIKNTSCQLNLLQKTNLKVKILSHGRYLMSVYNMRASEACEADVRGMNTPGLRTADVFPVVASLGGREATTGNTSAVRRLEQPPT